MTLFPTVYESANKPVEISMLTMVLQDDRLIWATSLATSLSSGLLKPAPNIASMIIELAGISGSLFLSTNLNNHIL